MEYVFQRQISHKIGQASPPQRLIEILGTTGLK